MASVVPSIDCIIDLDTYEFMNDVNDLKEFHGSLDDYAEEGSFDAEIIDYGICEEQEENFEEISPNADEPLKLESPKENTSKKASVNSPAITSCKNKQAIVKLVDCDKFPWYYGKYKSQILKRKYHCALEQAWSIMKYLKEAENDNILHIYDNNDDDKRNINKGHQNSSSSSKPIAGKVKRKHEKIAQSNKKEDSTNTKIVNIKKNIGLIGMKIQRVDNEALKETNAVQNNNRNEKVKKRIEKVAEFSQRADSSKPNRKDLDVSSSRLTNQIEKTKMDINNSKDTQQKDKDPENHNTSRKPSNTLKKDCKTKTQYRPMPKCKKIVTEKQKRDYNENILNKNIEASVTWSNDSTLKKNPIETSTPSTKENKEPVMKSFPVMNRFTGKIMKILNNSSKHNDKDHINQNKRMILPKTSSDTLSDKLNKQIEIKLNSDIKSNINKKECHSLTPTVATNVTGGQACQQRSILQNQYDSSAICYKMTPTVPTISDDKAEKWDTSKNTLVANQKITPRLNPSQQQNFLSQPFLSDNSKQVLENSLVNIQNYTQANIITDTKMSAQVPEILQELPESQEYIVPDIISTGIPSDNIKIQPTNVKNQLTHPYIQSQDPGSIHQQINDIQNSVAVTNSSFINVAITHPPQNEQNTTAIPVRLNMSVATNLPPGPFMRPHILKRSSQVISQYRGPRFQQPPPNAPVVPPFNGNMPPPSGYMLRPMPPWLLNRYQNPNNRYPNPNYGYQQNMNSPWSAAYPPLPANYNNNQKNYYQQPAVRGPSYQNMPYINHQMPPGTCNIVPKYDNIAFNYFNPVEPPRQPPPAQQSNNILNTSIIGKNNSGLIKKISIPNLATKTSYTKIKNKEEGTKKNNENVNTSTPCRKIARDMNDLALASKLTGIIRSYQNLETEDNQTVKSVNKAPDVLNPTKKNVKSSDISHTVHSDLKKSPKPIELQPQKPQPAQAKPDSVKKPKSSLLQTIISKMCEQNAKQFLKDNNKSGSLISNFETNNANSNNKSKEKKNSVEAPILEKLEKDKKESFPGTMKKDCQVLLSRASQIILTNIPLPDEPKIPTANKNTMASETLKRPHLDTPKIDKKNDLRLYRPGPRSKKIKLDVLATPQKSHTVSPTIGYSPPVLPIPTYQNILMDTEQIDSSNDDEKCTTIQINSSHDDDIISTSVDTPKRTLNKKKKSLAVKGILRNHLMQSEMTKEDSIKKISLDEYKKRVSK